MPRLDGRGPSGAGSGNGRGLGLCGVAEDYGYGCAHGRGVAGGKGCGRGFHHGWYAVGYGAHNPNPQIGSPRGAYQRATLEQRVASLRAELARAESLMEEPTGTVDPAASGEQSK